APVWRPAGRAAPCRTLSGPQRVPTTAATTDPGCAGGLVVGRSHPAARIGPGGSPAPGRPPDPRAVGAAGRADPYRRHAARAHVPPGVCPALADALASDAHHTQPPRPPAGGGADCAPGGG